MADFPDLNNVTVGLDQVLATYSGPKESVQPVNDWTRPLALEHRDLLSEGEDFESSITPTAKETRSAEMSARIESTWRNVGFRSVGQDVPTS